MLRFFLIKLQASKWSNALKQFVCKSRRIFWVCLIILRPAAFIQMRIQRRCFPANIAKFLEAAFYRTPPVAASVVTFIIIIALVILQSWLETFKKLTASFHSVLPPAFIKGDRIFKHLEKGGDWKNLVIMGVTNKGGVLKECKFIFCSIFFYMKQVFLVK